MHGFPGYAREEPKPTLLQVLNGEPPANTAPVRVDIPPGTAFRYSGGGTAILQLLLTEVMAKPFPDLMRELVLAPLGMRHSTFEQPLPEVLRNEVSTAHRAGAKPILGSWHVYPEMAAAGLWTTPSDLARFALAIESARSGTSSGLLLRRMAREMFTPQIEGGPGLGIFLEGVDGARRFGHSGGNEGFRCELVAYQDLGLGAVVMTNSDDGNYLVYELLGAIAAEYGWPAFREEREPAAVDVAMLGEYAGVYQYEPGYEMRVTRDGDTLRLVMPGGASIVLLPAGKNRFYSLSMGGEVEFVRDEGGSTLIMRQGPVESRLRKQD